MPRLQSFSRCLFAAVLLAAGVTQAMAQPARESAVKAAFLYKFGAFVEWPAGTFARPDDPLVIGVLGDDAVADDLEQVAAGRKVEGRPVVLKRLREADGPMAMQILFVGNMRAGRLREVLAAVTGPVLVVTEQDGALRAGSVVNLTTEAGRIRFSVSLAAAEARGLRLSARLLSVAQTVEKGR
ncbi:MAG: YfiR family protein [Burkholderiales bacterium]|nr:YfiR family protein [Burkholderiales bacterium]